MQQHMNLKPKMNDIDIFIDMSVETFNTTKDQLESAFGNPIRFHIGQFDSEENARGLVEFRLPPLWSERCAGAESVQLNFGKNHPWANPLHYTAQANVGMNQIAVGIDGNTIASQAFSNDMLQKNMSMNPQRYWTIYDWERTVKSLKRMIAERVEFKDWTIVHVPKPDVVVAGHFWQDGLKNPEPSAP